MPFLVYKGEGKLAELVVRAYGSDLKPAEAKRAEAAFVAANPQLGKLRDLKAGAVLVVPPLAGLTEPPARGTPGRESPARETPTRETPEREAPQHETPLGDELTLARVTIDAYRERLGARVADERAAVASAAELLKSKEVKELAKAFPESAAYIDRATAGAKALAADADARAAFVKTLAKVGAELEELAKRRN